MSVAVIINPISGTGGRPDLARARADLAALLLNEQRIDGDVHITSGRGDARELTQAALERGASTVVAWGGDGTVSEVASALAFREGALAIIPSGSGNGLARELGIPFDPRAAFARAVHGAERQIDCGELDGRLFFNIAGLGLDARVSYEFTASGLQRRGFRRYAELTIRELFRGTPEEHTVVVNGATLRKRWLILALANSRQYGNGAIIAPRARLDDGRLDLVLVSSRPALVALMQAPLLFLGAAALVPGVTMISTTEVAISSVHNVLYHVDGEVYTAGRSVTARVHPLAVRVRV